MMMSDALNETGTIDTLFQLAAAAADSSKVACRQAQAQPEPQQINLAALPAYAAETILDLGDDHLYSMANEVLVPTVDPRAEIARLEREIRQNRETGKFNTATELELLFQQRTEGMPESTYIPLLGLTICQAYDRWNRRGYWKDVAVDQAERTKSRLHICAMLYELTSELSNESRLAFLARAVLASLQVKDRVEVLLDLGRYLGSQRH